MICENLFFQSGESSTGLIEPFVEIVVALDDFLVDGILDQRFDGETEDTWTI